MEEGRESFGSYFEFSPENPPPLDILESKIFAVHATPILPKGGVLKAGARNISGDEQWDSEPPSFRPTIHFSLGEIVQEHDNHSWDDHSYAVVTPIKSLEGQLVNVFPNDTFILGDYHLSDKDILLIPRGANAADLPSNLNIVEYNPQLGLRSAVDQVIREKGGWSIRMKPEGVATGSVAYIDGVEINSPEFFKSLFDNFPKLSYGTHLEPEKGEAFRFGAVEQMVDNIMKNYSNHWARFSTVRVQLYKDLIEHNLSQLENSLISQALSKGAMDTFKEKQARLKGWLNIVDTDLEIRRRAGRTFTDASNNVQKQIRQARDNPDELQSVADHLLNELPFAKAHEDLSPALLASLVVGMAPEELRNFIEKHKEPFDDTNLAQFYSHYAVNRWLIVQDEEAKAESLDTMLQENLEASSANWDDEINRSIFRDISDYLTTDSNRLELALTIIRKPAVREHLTSRFGFEFTPDGPKTLEELIRAHPETRLLFNQEQLILSLDQQKAYKFLKKIGVVFEPKRKAKDVLNNLREAIFLSHNLKWAKSRLQDEIATFMLPMNTARNKEDLIAGDILSLYELLRRDKKPIAIWSQFGLEKEFRQMFPIDEQFWDSEYSLFQIYEKLNGSKTK